jgi:glycosyltransferase involved in cell wall biosynthesis
MKFSISTSFYKRGHLVESVYQQVLDQTYTNWEWIVTDDFSEENSAKEKLLEICSNDPRVKYYEQSRKKECFYNPQRGATGDIIVMFDSDDYAYPKVLEVYHHIFTKHPEVAGISCYAFTHYNGELAMAPEPWMFNSSVFGLTPMCRAFKNIFSEFDSGILLYHQNDTNIVRHIETIGKWLYLPRTLYYYNQSDLNSISRRTVSIETLHDIERERLYIENKFPELHHQDKLSTYTYFLPIMDLSRTLSLGDFCKSKEQKNILLIKSDIQLWERQLIKELYYDHNLYFNYNLNQNFDEIIVEVNNNILEKLFEIKHTLSISNPGTRIIFRNSVCDFNLVENKIMEIFGSCWRGVLRNESFFITGT